MLSRSVKSTENTSQEVKALEKEIANLRSAKEILEKKLSEEIENKKLKINMEDKGLVVNLVGEVLFNSGKADLRKDSFPILEKIANVIKENLQDNIISIEGHTDSDPIKYSHWKSNRELSLHRALTVCEYLEKLGVSPQKLVPMGWGEYYPVASNDTPEGKQQNRRVEIVIVPKYKQINKELVEDYKIEKNDGDDLLKGTDDINKELK